MKRDRVFQLRLSAPERQELARRAARMGVTSSDCVRLWLRSESFGIQPTRAVSLSGVRYAGKEKGSLRAAAHPGGAKGEPKAG